MRDENEIRLKRAYWYGVFDALNVPEKARTDKLDKEKLTAQVWLAAMDWLLGQGESPESRLERAGRDLTRERFIEAIESIRDFPLLPYTTLSFGPNDHQGLDQVYFTRLVDGSFVLMKDWTVIKDHVEEGGAKK